MSDKPRILHISIEELPVTQEEKEPPPPIVKVVPRPTIGIQARADLFSIHLEEFRDTGLALSITDAGAREITISDVGRIMHQATEVDVELDVRWELSDDEGTNW